MSDEKEVVNADEYAAMRKELVRLREAIVDHNESLELSLGFFEKTGDRTASAALMGFYDGVQSRTAKALDSCPIAAKLSEEEGGNG